MKVALLHNPKAGCEKPRAGELVRLLEKAGHQVRYQSVKEGGIGKTLCKSGDLIAIAGGDGTVRKVFRRMDRKALFRPVLILPLGTMNNIASCLELTGNPADLISSVPSMLSHPFYYHRISTGGFEDVFYESAGVGIWASFLHYAENHRAEVDAMSGGRCGPERDFAALAVFARDAPAIELEILSDGHRLRDRYLLAEIMNIPTVGPHMTWGTEDSLAGGNLQIALVAEPDRRALIDYFSAKADGGEATFPGIHRNHHGPVEISGAIREYHLDDAPAHLRTEARVTVFVGRSPKPVEILRSPRAG